MSKSIITKAKFKAWARRQPDERQWNYYNNYDCVVCSFVKETTGAKKVYASGFSFNLGKYGDTTSIPIPDWLLESITRLIKPSIIFTGAALKKEFVV